MANTAVTISKAVETFVNKFQGFCCVRWTDTRGALPSDGTLSWMDLPTLQDGVDFSAGEPTINKSYIYGKQTPWTENATPGDTTIAVTVAALDEALIELGFKENTVANGFTETAETSKNGKAGTWSFVGIDLQMKAITGSFWLISEDGKFSLLIRNFKGYARLVMEDNQPVGITFSGGFTTPEAEDTDGDVLFGTFEETV